MTHATGSEKDRHDTLPGVSGRSGRGTARQTIRVDESLWERFGEVVDKRGTDRSTLLREVIRRYIEDPAAVEALCEPEPEPEATS